MGAVVLLVFFAFILFLGMGIAQLTALSTSEWSAFLAAFPDRLEVPSSAWQSVAVAEFRAQYDIKSVEDRVQVSVVQAGLRMKLCERWCAPTEPILVPWNSFQMQIFRWRAGLYEEIECLQYQVRFAGPREVVMLVCGDMGRVIQTHLMESQIEEHLGKKAMLKLLIQGGD